MQRLNILYIHSHDTGRYVQPYGFAVKTPNIQKLAEDGVLFRQAFCANPTCSPSRAVLLTGMYAHSNGMTGLAHRGSRLSDYNKHLAHTMNKHGYHTALAGVQHVVGGEETHLLGYDDYLKPAEASDRNRGIAKSAAQFIHDNRDADEPFFLACGFFRTHRTGNGWHNEEESPLGDPRYVRPPLPLPDTPETREDFADFCVCAERLDACMGLVFDALEEAGLEDNTLVVCTTDHGIAFPHMKCNLLDHGIGVMLIMRGPQGFTGGKVVDAMVSHVDVFPTVCDVAGIEPPPWLQGCSFTPLVHGTAESTRSEVFAEVNFHACAEPVRAIRTDRWKYIRRFDVRSGPVLTHCDDSPSKSYLLENGWQERPQEEEYLFDLIFDPNEANNLAHDPNCAAHVAELRSRLDLWMEDTGDPLLSDRLDPWPGMIVNDENDVSPNGETRPAKPFVVT